jgi:hypothetical protein
LKIIKSIPDSSNGTTEKQAFPHFVSFFLFFIDGGTVTAWPDFYDDWRGIFGPIGTKETGKKVRPGLK